MSRFSTSNYDFHSKLLNILKKNRILFYKMYLSPLYTDSTPACYSVKRWRMTSPDCSIYRYQCFSLNRYQCFSLNRNQCFILNRYQCFSLYRYQCFSLYRYQWFSLYRYQCLSLNRYLCLSLTDINALA